MRVLLGKRRVSHARPHRRPHCNHAEPLRRHSPAAFRPIRPRRPRRLRSHLDRAAAYMPATRSTASTATQTRLPRSRQLTYFCRRRQHVSAARGALSARSSGRNPRTGSQWIAVLGHQRRLQRRLPDHQDDQRHADRPAAELGRAGPGAVSSEPTLLHGPELRSPRRCVRRAFQ